MWYSSVFSLKFYHLNIATDFGVCVLAWPYQTVSFCKIFFKQFWSAMKINTHFYLSENVLNLAISSKPKFDVLALRIWHTINGEWYCNSIVTQLRFTLCNEHLFVYPTKIKVLNIVKQGNTANLITLRRIKFWN